MQISNKTINNAINRKFIRPLKDGCIYNVSKLENEKRTKHHETISLLKQAHKTLINVDYNLKSYNLVDANTLLRSSFEYIMMAMMIQFDENVYNEFTINKPKKDTIIGLDGLKQVSTRIFYSYDDKKFIFLPICAISFVNGKLNKKEKNYQTTYNRLIGNKNVKEIGNIYTGEWVGVYKKNGEYFEGRYKGYHKTSNVLEYYINGLDTLSCAKICSSDLRIIIYTTDILGNRHIRLDTQKEI